MARRLRCVEAVARETDVEEADKLVDVSFGQASWVAEMRSTYSAIFGQAEVLRNGQTITANGSSNGNAPESLASEGGKLVRPDVRILFAAN